MDKQQNIQKGKLPPQALDLEEAVLGAMLIDKKGMDEVIDILKPENFYLHQNQLIYKAIQSLYRKREPVDLLTVSETLKKQGSLDAAGGDFRIIQLTQKVASSAHIEHHARIIQQKYLQRQMIAMANDVIVDAFDETKDVFDVLDKAGNYFDGINDTLSASYESVTWHDAVASLPTRIELLTNNNGKITGLPTGLDALDNHFSGWQPSDFIVIGADSGMGKTAFVMCSILACAKQGIPTGMFSMEMPVIQLAIRAMAVESHFHMNQLSRKGFSEDAPEKHTEYFQKLNTYADRIKDYPIHIDDKPNLTVSEMKRKARAMKRKHGIKLLVIDFMQMFSGDKDIRIVVGEAARECKNLAKELNIPVIGLSQLSRELRKSSYNIPKKYHLKEASAIEEAADVIALLYRPDYYGYDYLNNQALWMDELGLRDEENACLMVAKNRNGALGNVGLTYIENKTKYVNGSVTTSGATLQEAFADDDLPY